MHMIAKILALGLIVGPLVGCDTPQDSDMVCMMSSNKHRMSFPQVVFSRHEVSPILVALSTADLSELVRLLALQVDQRLKNKWYGKLRPKFLNLSSSEKTLIERAELTRQVRALHSPESEAKSKFARIIMKRFDQVMKYAQAKLSDFKEDHVKKDYNSVRKEFNELAEDMIHVVEASKTGPYLDYARGLVDGTNFLEKIGYLFGRLRYHGVESKFFGIVRDVLEISIILSHEEVKNKFGFLQKKTVRKNCPGAG